jgi:hypothetical protein
MTPQALQTAVADYAALEMEIDRLNRAKFAGLCAACRKPCCRADVCRDALESWWLRQVSRHVHGTWWPDDWRTRAEPIALGETGCLLKAGRPLICRSFFCESFLTPCRDVWEVVFYSFLSDLLSDAARLTSSVSLEQLDEADAPDYAPKIAERIERARRLLAVGMGLIEPGRPETDKCRIALSLLCHVPRFLRAVPRRAILARIEAATKPSAEGTEVRTG